PAAASARAAAQSRRADRSARRRRRLDRQAAGPGRGGGGGALVHAAPPSPPPLRRDFGQRATADSGKTGAILVAGCPKWRRPGAGSHDGVRENGRRHEEDGHMPGSDANVIGATGERFDEVLTPEAVAFVADLQRKFGKTREELLARRQQRRQQAADTGKLDFLDETREIREDT